MRFSSFIAAAAVTAPLAVSAAGTLGYALGARHSGNLYSDPGKGSES